MRIETNTSPSVIVTREVRLGGGLPGVEGLAEDIASGSLDLSKCRPELADALREARTRGMWSDPKEAATFALAFAAGAEDKAARGRTSATDAQAEADRRAAAERRHRDEERRVTERREAFRLAAERRASARNAAREEVREHPYVPEEAHEDVVRIMVERNLTVAEAYDAWVEEGDSSPSLGARSGLCG
jgi:hypothetical protein